MAKANDLEGRQDMGGKHGGQAGMPEPEDRSGAQQGIVKDERGQEQPADKARANKSAGRIAGTTRRVAPDVSSRQRMTS
jgi:hypothetical protein